MPLGADDARVADRWYRRRQRRGDDGRVPESSAVFDAQREAGSPPNLHARPAVSAFDRVLRTELRRSVRVDVGVDALPAPKEPQAAEHVVLRGGKDARPILKRRVQDGQITWGEARRVDLNPAARQQHVRARQVRIVRHVRRGPGRAIVHVGSVGDELPHRVGDDAGAEPSLIRCIDGTDEFVEVPGPRVRRPTVELQAIGRLVAGSRDCQRLAEAVRVRAEDISQRRRLAAENLERRSRAVREDRPASERDRRCREIRELIVGCRRRIGVAGLERPFEAARLQVANADEGTAQADAASVARPSDFQLELPEATLGLHPVDAEIRLESWFTGASRRIARDDLGFARQLNGSLLGYCRSTRAQPERGHDRRQLPSHITS